MADESLEKKCESFVKNEKGKLISCNQIGRGRYDRGLYAGVHCDDCWEKLVYNARQKSW